MTQDQYRAQCEYKRKGNVVTNLATGKPVDSFKYVNAAKRWVRENARFKTYRAD